MIDYFSEWAQNLTLAIVIVSLFEMLLPNNKTKKYIKVVMGLYILFNIISCSTSSNISTGVCIKLKLPTNIIKIIFLFNDFIISNKSF